MPISPGTRVGPYEVLGVIGAGGMGEVYRAHDLRLKRDVALKVLPASVASDPERLARLQREAEVLASLNHPNIAVIHGVEESGPSTDASRAVERALVLELVNGPTLDDRILEAPIAIPDVMSIARQIAVALEAAHEQGIVHRDLKPANIKIRPDGLVKVLDFGLAKATAAPNQPLDSARASAETVAGTREGMILGTTAYMSPEQTRGHAVDKRCDIWSFGCVLFEMLAGSAAFARNTASDTIAAILERPPNWAALPPDTPEPIRRLLERCLEKDPGKRLRDIGEARIEIDAVTSIPVRPAHRMTARRLAFVGLGVIVVSAIVWSQREPPDAGLDSPLRSLAVLPLRPLMHDSRENYIGLGIADSIILGMSRARSLTVRPTSAVHRYAVTSTDALEAAKALQVDSVLDGTWHREGDRLRIAVNLLRVADGSSLWTDALEVRAGDVFAIQDQVAERLISRLRVQIDPRRRSERRGTDSLEAYDSYTRGRFYFGERGFGAGTRSRKYSDTAIELFQRAIHLDPDYPDAHAMLGFAYAWTAVFIENNPSLIELADEYTRIAERLGGNLGQVHLTRAFTLWSWYKGWRIVDAIREQRLAAELDPGLPDLELSALYVHLGFFDEWRATAERILALDPTNQQMKSTFVNEHYLSNLPEEGLAAQRRLLNQEMDVRYLLLTRRVGEAAPLVEKQASESPDSPFLAIRLGLLRALQNRHEEARAIADKALPLVPKNRSYHHATYDVARIHALAGRAGSAARWLLETIEWGFPNYPMFASDPFLDPVRQAPEVLSVISNLKTQWEAYRHELEMTPR